MTHLLSSLRDSASAPAGTLVGVQYLRGVAALAVVLQHSAGISAQYFGAEVLDGFFYRGEVGVQLFFIISGFIIAVIALGKGTLAPAPPIGTFFARRVARIVPLMWLAVIAFAALKFAGRGDVDIGASLRAFFLWPAGTVEPSVIWTLRHEAIFYIVFAATFLSRQWARWLLLAWVVLPIPLAVTLTGDSLGEDIVLTIFNPVNLLFGLGLAFGLAWLRWGDRLRMPAPVALAPLLTVLFVAVMFLAHLVNFHAAPLFDRAIYPAVDVSATALAAFGLTTIGCAALLALALCPRETSGEECRIGLLMGSASYAIYLFHPHIETAIIAVWSKVLPGTPIFVVIFGVALVATLCCIAVHIIVEKPLVRFTQRLLRARSAASQSARA